MLGHLIKLLVAPRLFYFVHFQERNKTERSSTHAPSLINKLRTLFLQYRLFFFFAEVGSQNNSNNGAEYTRLQKQNQQLREENNFLKYKIEVLLDMVSQSSIIMIQSNLHVWQPPISIDHLPQGTSYFKYAVTTVVTSRK